MLGKAADALWLAASVPQHVMCMIAMQPHHTHMFTVCRQCYFASCVSALHISFSIAYAKGNTNAHHVLYNGDVHEVQA